MTNSFLTTWMTESDYDKTRSATSGSVRAKIRLTTQIVWVGKQGPFCRQPQFEKNVLVEKMRYCDNGDLYGFKFPFPLAELEARS